MKHAHTYTTATWTHSGGSYIKSWGSPSNLGGGGPDPLDPPPSGCARGSSRDVLCVCVQYTLLLVVVLIAQVVLSVLLALCRDQVISLILPLARSVWAAFSRSSDCQTLRSFCVITTFVCHPPPSYTGSHFTDITINRHHCSQLFLFLTKMEIQ